MSETVQLVLCTCPSPKVAESLAETLVAEDLAACVNVLPGITSIYQWHGDTQKDSEALLFIKTTAERYPAMERRIEDIHPYDVPEIIAVPVTAGLASYLNWVRGGGDD